MRVVPRKAAPFVLCGTEGVFFEQYSELLAQRKEFRGAENETEDAGRLTPVKDDNEVLDASGP
jgi:hypothetical protein